MKTNGFCRDEGVGSCAEPYAKASWGGLFLCACLPVWLGGCTTSADPHEGGFVSGVAGLAGGGYQRRIDEREGVHREELDAQQRLKAQAHALEQERLQVRGDLARARTRLAGQERRIAEARARLSAEPKRPAAAQADLRRIDEAQARLASAKIQLGALQPNVQPLTNLQARSQNIHKELDEIDNMVDVVSESRF